MKPEDDKVYKIELTYLKLEAKNVVMTRRALGIVEGEPRPGDNGFRNYFKINNSEEVTITGMMTRANMGRVRLFPRQITFGLINEAAAEPLRRLSGEGIMLDLKWSRIGKAEDPTDDESSETVEVNFEMRFYSKDGMSS